MYKKTNTHCSLCHTVDESNFSTLMSSRDIATAPTMPVIIVMRFVAQHIWRASLREG